MSIKKRALIDKSNGWTSYATKSILSSLTQRGTSDKVLTITIAKEYKDIKWIKSYLKKMLKEIDLIIDIDFRVILENERLESGNTLSLEFPDYQEGLNKNYGVTKVSRGSQGYATSIVSRISGDKRIDKHTLIHELGHALGLDHPEGNGWNKLYSNDDTIMSYNLGSKGYAKSFTRSDKRALLRLWGPENDEAKKTFKGQPTNVNRLVGTDDSDELIGGAVDDFFYGGSGPDLIIGRSGKDTAIFSDVNNSIDLRVVGYQETGDGNDFLLSIESIDAGSGDDIVIGNSSANTLRGQKGNDILKGKKGDDILIAGRGKDKVWGGRGRDTFRLSRGAGYDIIKDFADGEDRIQFAKGTSKIKILSDKSDIFLYHQDDLLAKVIDAAGDIQKNGQYLI